MSITPINTPKMQMYLGMKELVESICGMDCYDLEAGAIIPNPYDINEDEYEWYKDYALKVFGVVAVPSHGQIQAE